MTPEEHAIAVNWSERKTALMEEILGKQHNIVNHAIFPFSMGGVLDLHYFPSGRPGTAIATMELTRMPGKGPSNEVYRTYELVMFTRHALSLDDAHNKNSPFGKAHAKIASVLNLIAMHRLQTRLNPGNTAEAPKFMFRTFLNTNSANPDQIAVSAPH